MAEKGTELVLHRPEPSEYDPAYSAYVDTVGPGDVLSLLSDGIGRTLSLLRTCPRDREQFRYEPGKWSIREVAGHMADAERLYAYRVLHLARRDPSPLPGMDRHVWARASNASRRPLAELAKELASVRAATLSLFASFDPSTSTVAGVAAGRSFTVRSLAFVIAGHEIHHRRILEERYLGGGEDGRVSR